MKIKILITVLPVVIALVSCSPAVAPTAIPATATPTAIPPTATPIMNSVLAGPFTLTISGRQLVITWDPGEISGLLSKYVQIGGFLFRKTGVMNSDGTEQAEVTAVNIADTAGLFKNTGNLTLPDLKSGDYIIILNGMTENLATERIASTEFQIP